MVVSSPDAGRSPAPQRNSPAAAAKAMAPFILKPSYRTSSSESAKKTPPPSGMLCQGLGRSLVLSLRIETSAPPQPFGVEDWAGFRPKSAERDRRSEEKETLRWPWPNAPTT